MCNCLETASAAAVGVKGTNSAVASTVRAEVPLATAVEPTTESDEPELRLPPGFPLPEPTPFPIPHLKPCHLDFRDGCYVIHHTPTASLVSFEGTLRVDRAAPDAGPDNIIVSGDLYRKPLVLDPIPIPIPIPIPGPGGEELEPLTAAPPASVAAAAARVTGPPAVALPLRRPGIPIFPRARYHSYLKVTSVSAPAFTIGTRPCQLTLVCEQFNYTHPPAGSHKGTFPNAPTRTVTIRLKRVAAPFPYSLTGGPYYEGRLFEGGVDKGTVTLAWVSKFFRRAVLEIDTLVGSVPPTPVPALSGSGTEFFDTIFSRTGWQLSVISDQTNVPVPAGVTATNCWNSADLHNLMTTVRKPTTNLDAEWRVHLVIVPAKLGCARGVMYDQIGVPREGCASFSDDGYPTSDSANFGVAANQKQRDFPRAYLRSATHEVTHTFNQIHQEIETTSDNSIMSTTPTVADVLGGPATGEPGVFPTEIALVHNTTVRHHLNHMPDPVIRPGGWPFSSWFPSGAPQASDRHLFDASEIDLAVTCESDRVVLGQPVELSWTLTNRSAAVLMAPNEVTLEGTFASISVADGEGRTRPVHPFVVACDTAKISVLEPGESRSASTRLFWSSAGFAFERPGRYTVTVAVSWSANGIPVSVAGSVTLFVDFPLSDGDNRAAGLVLHPEVGKWVALGGGAYHLDEAVRRLLAVQDTAADTDGPPPRLLEGFTDLMPDRARAARVIRDLGAPSPPRRPAVSKRAPTPKRKSRRRPASRRRR